MAPGGWPGYDEDPVRPVVVMPAQRPSRRARNASEAQVPRLAAGNGQQVIISSDGQMLAPVAVDQFGRPLHRASSISGGRPAQIIINNDNGGANFIDESGRPVSASGRPIDFMVDNQLVRRSSGRRSTSRVRRRTPSPYEHDGDEYEIEHDDQRRVIRYGRPPYKPKRSKEDEEALRRLEEYEKEREEKAACQRAEEALREKERKEKEARKLIEEELNIKRLKEEEKEKRRKEEEKKLKEEAILEYKEKQAKEEAKREAEKREEEEKMISLLMRGSGMTESEARKFIRRAERKDKGRRKDSDELERPEMFEDTRVGKLRPTYVKVHQKHISPETLDVFKLPWYWDDRDTGYIVIKQWVSERDQEILFNHTRQVNERARITYPRNALKADQQQIVVVKDKANKTRKKSPLKRTSWFLT